MANVGPTLSKGERVDLFRLRLQEQPPAANHDEALGLIAKTLHAVEDAFSGVPYNPEEPGTDGRLYPPNERFRYLKWERPHVRCYRQVAHATFVAENGAIEIRKRLGSELADIIFKKQGKDGREVSDYDSSE